MVLPALLPASCLKITCFSAEWLACFWHLKDGVKLHAVASQVPPETCGCLVPAPTISRFWYCWILSPSSLSSQADMPWVMLSLGLLGFLKENTVRAPATQNICCLSWPLACEDGLSQCLFFLLSATVWPRNKPQSCKYSFVEPGKDLTLQDTCGSITLYCLQNTWSGSR